MQDFPANSAKAKKRPAAAPKTEERPEVKQVTSAETRRRKRGLGRQFKDTFIGGSAKDAAEYMLVDVVVPTVRDMVAEAMQSGIERLIYGESKPRRGSSTPSYSSVGRVNYAGMSSPVHKPPAQRMLSRQARSRHDFGEIVIPNRNEANEVLEMLDEILSRYGVVEVAALYELTGIQSSHTDHKWGWTSLAGAKAQRLRNNSYLLKLPDPEPLD